MDTRRTKNKPIIVAIIALFSVSMSLNAQSLVFNLPEFRFIDRVLYSNLCKSIGNEFPYLYNSSRDNSSFLEFLPDSLSKNQWKTDNKPDIYIINLPQPVLYKYLINSPPFGYMKLQDTYCLIWKPEDTTLFDALMSKTGNVRQFKYTSYGPYFAHEGIMEIYIKFLPEHKVKIVKTDIF